MKQCHYMRLHTGLRLTFPSAENARDRTAMAWEVYAVESAFVSRSNMNICPVSDD